MDLLDKMHRAAFLGPEFLTWLWYRSETGGGEFALDPEFGDFEVWFEDKLVVGSATVNAQENLFKGGHPAGSLEARTALRLGKFATDAKLRIVRGAQEWTFGLKAHDLVPTGIKIPAVLSKEDDDRFYERMYLVENLDTMIKGLFGLFVKLRVSPRWDAEELPLIRRWIAGEDVEPIPLDPAAMGVKAAEVKAPGPDPEAPEKAWPPLAELAGTLRADQPGFGAPHDSERVAPAAAVAETEPEAPPAAAEPTPEPEVAADAAPAEEFPPIEAPAEPEPEEMPTLEVPDPVDDDVPPWEAAAADDETPPWE